MEEEEAAATAAAALSGNHINGGNSNSSNIHTGVRIPIESPPPPPLKGSLKKRRGDEDFAADEMINQQGRGTRRVSWSDAHGYDIAHIQFFQSSGSNDGELEGVRNSCVCVIQ